MLTRIFLLYKLSNPNELSDKQFKELEKELKAPEETFSDEYLDFLLWCKSLPSRQETFGNFISKKLAKYPGAKILEVGCGRTARLSRYLSQKGFNVTCIDSIVEPETMTDNVNAIVGLFDHTTFDLSEYDFVIAQEPCDATEHVVLACKAQNKPFFMSLCGTPHQKLNGEFPKDYQEWFDHLLNVSDGYAKLIWLSLDPFSRTPVLKSKTGF